MDGAIRLHFAEILVTMMITTSLVLLSLVMMVVLEVGVAVAVAQAHLAHGYGTVTSRDSKAEATRAS